MPLGQARRVWWTTGPVPGPRHGGKRGRPSAWHAYTPQLFVPSGHGGAASETGPRQPLPASGVRLSTNAGLDRFHGRAELIANQDSAEPALPQASQRLLHESRIPRMGGNSASRLRFLVGRVEQVSVDLGVLPYIATDRAQSRYAPTAAALGAALS
jgi:hypothetical protein